MGIPKTIIVIWPRNGTSAVERCIRIGFATPCQCVGCMGLLSQKVCRLASLSPNKLSAVHVCINFAMVEAKFSSGHASSNIKRREASLLAMRVKGSGDPP